MLSQKYLEKTTQVNFNCYIFYQFPPDCMTETPVERIISKAAKPKKKKTIVKKKLVLKRLKTRS